MENVLRTYLGAHDEQAFAQLFAHGIFQQMYSYLQISNIAQSFATHKVVTAQSKERDAFAKDALICSYKDRDFRYDVYGVAEQKKE